MTNVNLNLRNPKEKKPQSIWAVFFVDSKRIKINTDQFVHPDNWSRKTQRSKSGHSNYKLLNDLLDEQVKFIKDYVADLSVKKKRFYADDLKVDFNNHFKIGIPVAKSAGEPTDFISFIDKYISERIDLKDGSLMDLKVARMHIIIAFKLAPKKMIDEWNSMTSTQKGLNPDFLQADKVLDFDEIGYDWIAKFYRYLLTTTYTAKRKGETVELNYSKNYVSKIIRKTKLFCHHAKKYIKDTSYEILEVEGEEADTVYLDWNEIGLLKSLNLDPLSLRGKVRNLFVFNCYLGLRYSDLEGLSQNRFESRGEQLYLKIRLQKTDVQVFFPVLPSAVEILKTYNYVLPRVDDEDFNRVIKELLMEAGIIKIEHKRITRGKEKIVQMIPKYDMVASHTARRSFATNFFKDGVPVRQLMAVTGHTTEGSFMRYVKSKNEETFTEFIAVGANR